MLGDKCLETRILGNTGKLRKRYKVFFRIAGKQEKYYCNGLPVGSVPINRIVEVAQGDESLIFICS